MKHVNNLLCLNSHSHSQKTFLGHSRCKARVLMPHAQFWNWARLNSIMRLLPHHPPGMELQTFVTCHVLHPSSKLNRIIACFLIVIIPTSYSRIWCVGSLMRIPATSSPSFLNGEYQSRGGGIIIRHFCATSSIRLERARQFDGGDAFALSHSQRRLRWLASDLLNLVNWRRISNGNSEARNLAPLISCSYLIPSRPMVVSWQTNCCKCICNSICPLRAHGFIKRLLFNAPIHNTRYNQLKTVCDGISCCRYTVLTLHVC